GARVLSVSDTGVVRVWDAATGRELFALADPPEPVSAAALSPDGARVAVGHVDGSVRVGDGRAWNVLRLKAGSRAVALRWSPDGSRLSLLRSTGEIQVWDTGAARVVLSQKLDRTEAVAGEFSPDGSRVAVTAGSNVTLYDVSTGSPEKDFEADPVGVAA